MKAKHWICGWALISAVALSVLGYCVYRVDPFFHYHKPDTDTYFYPLEGESERNLNDGILKHFDYDAVITGTSMVENFKTSEMDSLFGTNSVKVPFSGGSYKEVNDALKTALSYNENLKMVVRCLDMNYFFDDKDRMRDDLGEYPTYLYDKNPFNDVKYLFNYDVLWERTRSMIADSVSGRTAGGITSFDTYGRWQYNNTFGADTVFPTGVPEYDPQEEATLTEEDKETLRVNVEQNITSLAEKYPDVQFYYFFSPYSIFWWQQQVANGNLTRQLEAEKYVISLILQVENIHLFSFNNRSDIIADLNNYTDITHYGMWVNSLILHWLYTGEYQLTEDNYLSYCQEEADFFSAYDYSSMADQVDYENDFYMEALYREELTGIPSRSLLNTAEIDLELKSGATVSTAADGETVLRCEGTSGTTLTDESALADILRTGDYAGASVALDDIGEYHYLACYGKLESGSEQGAILLLDEAGDIVCQSTLGETAADGEWHQYLIDVSQLSGAATVVFYGGTSVYLFRDAVLY